MKLISEFDSGGEKFKSVLEIYEGYEEHNQDKLYLGIDTKTVNSHCGGCSHHWYASIDLPREQIKELFLYLDGYTKEHAISL